VIWKGIERLFSMSGELTHPVTRNSYDENDLDLLNALDELDIPLRNRLILRYANGLSLEQVAQITGDGPSQVTDVFELALKRLAEKVTSENEDIESTLARILASCWSVTQPSPEEMRAFTRSINGQASGWHALRGRVTTVREMAVIGLAILIVFLMIWGGNRFFLRPEEGSNLPGTAISAPPRSTEAARSTPEKSLSSASTPGFSQPSQRPSHQIRPTMTPTPTGVFYYVEEGDTLAEIAARFSVQAEDLLTYNRIPEGAILAPRQPLVIPGSLPERRSVRATPVTPVSRRTIARPTNTEDVFALLNPDVFPFNTLWLDAEVITYPGRDQSSVPTISRIQVWLSQRQFLLIGGPMGMEPEEVGIGALQVPHAKRPLLGGRGSFAVRLW
jgi:LysM repeat protein